MRLIKNTLVIASALILLFLPMLVLAQDSTEYELLEPLPFVAGSDGVTTANEYIPGMVRLIIAIAGALAVIKIVFGGIQYMSTDAFQKKNDAKSTISNAIWGLVLIISAWLILYTVNPNLVNFNFNIEGQRVGGDFDSSLGGVSTTSPDGVTYGLSYGKPWPTTGGSDSVERASLSANGITVKEPSCTTIGQGGCTSVAGISNTVTSGLAFLKDACKCTFTVTGGTEYWLHGNKSTESLINPTQHKPGGRVVDLRKISAGVLDSFIMSKERVSGSGCSSLGPAYRYNGITFVDERTHWHVCF